MFESDLCFFVEFSPEALSTYADTCFGFLESLEQPFGKPVNLVVGFAAKNPYFLESAKKTRVPVHAYLSQAIPVR